MDKQNRFFSSIDHGIEYLASAILAFILLIGLLQVFNRYFLGFSMSWSEEVQIFGHIWIAFLGIAIAYRRNSHLYIETFCDKLPPRPRSVFNLMVELMWGAFALALIILGWQVAQVAHMQESPGLEIPMSYPYYGLVIGGIYTLFVTLRRLFGGVWRVES
ncbi:putative TRAP transporter small permease protein [Betaproteobacteria bacterium]|nr:putative TRAP transporter small permease protein [Betaproteobacteria bacterium]